MERWPEHLLLKSWEDYEAELVLKRRNSVTANQALWLTDIIDQVRVQIEILTYNLPTH